MTEAFDPFATSPVREAADDLRATLTRLGSADLDTVSADELLELVGAMRAVSSQADAVTMRLLHAIDRRGVCVQRGNTSTAAWLRWAHRFHPAEAIRVVRTARALHDDPAGPLVPVGDDVERPREQLRAAFTAGEVSAEHVQVVLEVMQKLTSSAEADVRAQVESFLLEEARRHDPKALAHLGRHLRHVLDPDGGDDLARDDEQKVAARTLEIRSRNDGSSDVRGRLDPELTALFRSQLTPLAAPHPAKDGVPDLRTTGRRNADALAELLRRYAAAELSPYSHGAAATVTVTMALETLERRLGSSGATLGWSGPVSAETARRLACDARIIPVVLGTKGEPLDVGRASYPVTAAIWRALVVRDGGCSFHGCDRPPEWTEAHHIRFWGDGGETSVDNCCLFCDHHHRVVHHEGWEVQLIDGVVHVLPPPWIDPDRVPRRHTPRARLASLLHQPESACGEALDVAAHQPILLATYHDAMTRRRP
jgi:uncharacterized protein DUF222